MIRVKVYGVWISCDTVNDAWALGQAYARVLKKRVRNARVAITSCSCHVALIRMMNR